MNTRELIESKKSSDEILDEIGPFHNPQRGSKIPSSGPQNWNFNKLVNEVDDLYFMLTNHGSPRVIDSVEREVDMMGGSDFRSWSQSDLVDVYWSLTDIATDAGMM